MMFAFLNKYEPKNKKLRKLLRDPRRFYFDSKLYRVLTGTNNNKVIEASVAPDKTNKQPSVIFDLRDLKIQCIGSNWLSYTKFTNENLKVDEIQKINVTSSKDRFHKDKIVLFYGISRWKMSFVAEYMDDYLAAFADETISYEQLKSFATENTIAAIVLWGARNEPKISALSKNLDIPIWRIEDGFIRSYKLGSDFVLPQSLVIDKSGIYFDSTAPSDLENLLNYWNLEDNQKLIEQSKNVIYYFQQLGLSKYNFPRGNRASLNDIGGVKGEGRVLVIGQLESDASLKYGGCENWTNQMLISYACKENPDKIVEYRPHPDEIKKDPNHQKNIAESNPQLIINSDIVDLATQFYGIEHLYTMTSLVGLEALIFGIKVTTVGKPFYAGWGLTDDRAKIERRYRQLSIAELLCVVYLVYPKYYAGRRSNLHGMLGAITQITAARWLDELRINQARQVTGAIDLLESDSWFLLVLADNSVENINKHGKNFVHNLPIDKIISDKFSDRHKRVMLYLVSGVIEKSNYINDLLIKLEEEIDEDLLKNVVMSLWEMRPTPARLEAWIRYCERIGAIAEARRALFYRTSNTTYPKGWGPFTRSDLEQTLSLIEFDIRNKSFDIAFESCLKVILSGYHEVRIFYNIAIIALQKLDIKLVHAMYEIIAHIDPLWSGGYSFIMKSRMEAVLKEPIKSLESLAIALSLNVRNATLVREDSGFSVEHQFNNLPVLESMVESCCKNGVGDPIAQSVAYVAIEAFENAELLLKSSKPALKDEETWTISLSQALSYQGKFDEAKKLVKAYFDRFRSKPMYREAFRLAAQADDVEWCKWLLKDMQRRNVSVSETYVRKAATLTGDVGLYYKSLRKMGSTDILRKYFGKKLIQTLQGNDFSVEDELLVLAYFGPGDELRWAVLYPRMIELAKPAKVKFTCDPRLLTLLSRSFRTIEFVGSQRERGLKSAEQMEMFDGIGGHELFRHMDKHGWREAQKSTKLAIGLDLIADVVKSNDDIEGAPYLVCDESLELKWRDKIRELNLRRENNNLRQPRFRVGICWRSSLASSSRNQYYLSIEHVIRLMESIPDVDFYSLQYGDCSAEMKIAEKKCPRRLHRFEDLDYYDDFDGLAALMRNMDCIVAPGTTVVELGAALGVRTLYFSTTSENNWRIIDKNGTDSWQKSMVHVNPKTPLDKDGTVEMLIVAIQREKNNFFNIRKNSDD